MTDEDRTALRESIEGMTIREARLLAEKSEETLRVLGELGIAQPRTQGVGQAPQVAIGLPPGARPLGLVPPLSAAATGMCPCCGRLLDGTATSFSDCTLGLDCPAMAHRQTNKPNGVVHSLPTNPHAVLGDRAALLAMPAIGPDGDSEPS